MVVLVLLSLALLGQTVTAQDCISGEIRTVTDNGRDFVQYCVSGEWRLHCIGESLWHREEAAVACRQLGYEGFAGSGLFGPFADNPGAASTPNFFRFAAECVGNEDSVQECGGDVRELDSCTTASQSPLPHGVADCLPADCTNGEIRLVNGSTNREGRVELCMDGHWGTVCNNDPNLAGAVCAQLRYPPEGTRLGTFSPRAAPSVTCSIQSDTDTLQCNRTDICDNPQSLGVVCTTLEEYRNLIINETLQSITTQQPTASSNDGATIALGIIVALLVIVLVIAIIGWILTGIKLSRSRPSKEDRGTAGVHFTPTDTNVARNNSVQEKRYRKTKPTTSPKPDPFTQASKKGDDFHNAEEHTYAMVDKKAKKKAPKNVEMEEDPHVYDTAMDGETSWGVQEGEEYSKLQR